MDKIALMLSALMLAAMLMQGCHLVCTTAYPRHPGDPAGDRDCTVVVKVPPVQR